MSRLRNNPWVSLLVLSLGFFMILLDTTIVNIAVPSIIDGLQAGLDQILWVLNAYILVYAVLLILAGRLGDIYGPRNLFVVGLGVFTVASAACGVAQDVSQLIAARVLQGLGAALLTPQTLSTLTSIFPPERRGAAFGVWGAVAGVAAIAGPTLGGFLVNVSSWRAIFFVNLPIGALTIAAALLVLPDLRPGRKHGLDLVGVILSTAGLFGLIFGLIEGGPFNWGAIWGPLTIWEIIGAGILLLAAFMVWERYQKEPLLPLALFQNRNFALMNFVAATVAFGMLGFFLPFVIYLQSARGLTPFNAGLTLLPMSLVSMPMAPIAGRLADRIGGKYLLMAGLFLFAIGIGYLDLVAGPDSQWHDFLPGFLIAGVGMGITFAPMTTVAMRNITPRLSGAASGVLNTTRQLGAVMGTAAVGALLQNRLGPAFADEAVKQAHRLPAQFRQAFIDGFAASGSGGLQVGRGQTGAAHLPAGLPPQAVAQFQFVAHDVFVNGFIAAARHTILLPVAVILLGSLCCLLIQRRAAAAEAAEEQRAAAALAAH